MALAVMSQAQGNNGDLRLAQALSYLMEQQSQDQTFAATAGK